tara:strand:+ start:1135 stop:1266 length:132 start_codon:yes stop_codon:yes gene_type:complete
MAKIKAYVAEHEIAKTLMDILEPIAVIAVCLGTAPALMWLSSY